MNRLQSNGNPRSTFARQDPVSCQLCRTKKLKCDRQQPCSNCSARGVGCQPPTTSTTSTTRRVDRQLPSTGNRKTLASPVARDSESEILARLKKLEDAVFLGMHGSSFPTSSSYRKPEDPEVVPESSANEEHRVAAQWLERIGTREDVSPENSGNIHLKTEPIHRLLADPSIIQVGHAPAHFPGCVRLPTRSEAMDLFSYYMDNVHYLHPVTHSQSVRNIIHAVYHSPDSLVYSGRPADIALLLSIFASASHLWSPRERSTSTPIFTSAKAATQMSSIWSKTAFDILEYSRRTTSGSIESLQATIIISYLCYNVQGFSETFRSLHSIAITMARGLSLHKTDNLRKGTQQLNYSPASSTIENEIKRRIWWHIASTDWLFAFSSGPQEGTYSIQPAHMCVNYPQYPQLDGNIPVPILNGQLPNTESLLPSPISYLLQRIRLSEVCRLIVDSLPRFLENVETISYEHVIALDSRFENLLDTLPAFFRLDNYPDIENYHDVHNNTDIGNQNLLKRRSFCTQYSHSQVNNNTTAAAATQRYLVHLGIHTRRSKLHHPFLVRGFVDHKYAYSRNACLSSAQTVLRVCQMLLSEEKMTNDNSNNNNNDDDDMTFCIPARLGTVVHHVFMAAIVLVMDICFNKTEIEKKNNNEESEETKAKREKELEEDQQRKSQVADACKVLETLNNNYSSMAKKFLDPLMEVLRRHEERLLCAIMRVDSGSNATSATAANHHHHHHQQRQQQQATLSNSSLSMEEELSMPIPTMTTSGLLYTTTDMQDFNDNNHNRHQQEQSQTKQTASSSYHDVNIGNGDNNGGYDTIQQEQEQEQEQERTFNEMLQNYVNLGQNVDVPVPIWDDLFADFGSCYGFDIGE